MSEEKKSPSMLRKWTFGVFAVLVLYNFFLKVFPNEIKEPTELSDPRYREEALMQARENYLATKPDTLNYGRRLGLDEIKKLNTAIEKINEVKAEDIIPYTEGQSYQQFDLEVQSAIEDELILLAEFSIDSHRYSVSTYRIDWIEEYGDVTFLYLAAFWGVLLLLNLIKLVRKQLREVRPANLK